MALTALVLRLDFVSTGRGRRGVAQPLSTAPLLDRRGSARWTRRGQPRQRWRHGNRTGSVYVSQGVASWGGLKGRRPRRGPAKVRSSQLPETCCSPLHRHWHGRRVLGGHTARAAGAEHRPIQRKTAVTGSRNRTSPFHAGGSGACGAANVVRRCRRWKGRCFLSARAHRGCRGQRHPGPFPCNPGAGLAPRVVRVPARPPCRSW